MHQTTEISHLAVVETEDIGEGTQVYEFAVIRASVKIGRNVVIHPHVVINSGTILGDGVEVFPGAVIGKEPKGAGALARQPNFEKHVFIGNNSSIGPHAVIFYDVEIGQNTMIGDGASIREQCRVGSNCIVSRYVTINYNTTIGDRTKIMDLTHITGNCRIGNNVFISVNIGTTNDNMAGAKGYREEHVIGPTIQDGGIIGAGATLLPGVDIGRNAVVGAGSVVSKNVPENSVVMGIPARVKRKLVREER